MGSISTHFYVFLALVKRDLKVLKSRLVGLFIDNVITLTLDILVIGHLLPLLGMSNNLIGPFFIGMVIYTMFDISQGLAIELVYDLEFHRFIDYQLTLPLPIGWLITSYITRAALEAATIAVPRLFVGMFLLRRLFTIHHTHWLALIIMLVLALIFFATLTILFSFGYTFEWFNQNIWSRRIDPLFALAGIFIVWRKLYAFSPWIGLLFFLNPVTHTAEGIRSAFIGGDAFLPIWVCIFGVVLGICLNIWLLLPRVRKKLDYV